MPLLFSAACATTLLFSTAPARAQQSFSISATPAKLYLNQHGVAASTIAIQPVNGFAGAVTLSVSGLPKGVVAEFKPDSTTGTSTLVLEASVLSVIIVDNSPDS